jgi:hypothetical protein
MMSLAFTLGAPVGGIVDFPALGAFLGWFLVVALVGMGLHLLRLAGSPGPSATPRRQPLTGFAHKVSNCPDIMCSDSTLCAS